MGGGRAGRARQAHPPALPAEAEQWSADERALAEDVLAGRTVVVNVRKGGPHRRLVPWLTEQDLVVYVGHASNRHSWPESDFANPFVREARTDRVRMVEHYREWLADQPELLRRLRAGELTGRALGCWCAPEPCHADVLAEQAGG
ncbi:DUF4326 domain-containing protein [Goodfellowiella coeruleoviolacea]|uniref:DUF4326 domain-containing protein n=1 Tax=Goodfellowiella coeruleoviolacea TaxID=334858 RepID=A0AAE3GLD1_9PSEU|nr:DUF4326 domain-containing protein [Goodfellowiella coeruleoviolacea]MCP2170336.1 protein of unknown function (DUF4326) [Goodfellowiella coeruleoviolacea]